LFQRLVVHRIIGSGIIDQVLQVLRYFMQGSRMLVLQLVICRGYMGPSTARSTDFSSPIHWCAPNFLNFCSACVNLGTLMHCKHQHVWRIMILRTTMVSIHLHMHHSTRALSVAGTSRMPHPSSMVVCKAGQADKTTSTWFIRPFMPTAITTCNGMTDKVHLVLRLKPRYVNLLCSPAA
jgi:hypothetical protein